MAFSTKKYENFWGGGWRWRETAEAYRSMFISVNAVGCITEGTYGL